MRRLTREHATPGNSNSPSIRVPATGSASKNGSNLMSPVSSSNAVNTKDVRTVKKT